MPAGALFLAAQSLRASSGKPNLELDEGEAETLEVEGEVSDQETLAEQVDVLESEPRKSESILELEEQQDGSGPTAKTLASSVELTKTLQEHLSSDSFPVSDPGVSSSAFYVAAQAFSFIKPNLELDEGGTESLQFEEGPKQSTVIERGSRLVSELPEMESTEKIQEQQDGSGSCTESVTPSVELTKTLQESLRSDSVPLSDPRMSGSAFFFAAQASAFVKSTLVKGEAEALPLEGEVHKQKTIIEHSDVLDREPSHSESVQDIQELQDGSGSTVKPVTFSVELTKTLQENLRADSFPSSEPSVSGSPFYFAAQSSSCVKPDLESANSEAKTLQSEEGPKQKAASELGTILVSELPDTVSAQEVQEQQDGSSPLVQAVTFSVEVTKTLEESVSSDSFPISDPCLPNSSPFFVPKKSASVKSNLEPEEDKTESVHLEGEVTNRKTVMEHAEIKDSEPTNGESSQKIQKQQDGSSSAVESVTSSADPRKTLQENLCSDSFPVSDPGMSSSSFYFAAQAKSLVGEHQSPLSAAGVFVENQHAEREVPEQFAETSADKNGITGEEVQGSQIGIRAANDIEQSFYSLPSELLESTIRMSEPTSHGMADSSLVVVGSTSRKRKHEELENVPNVTCQLEKPKESSTETFIVESFASFTPSQSDVKKLTSSQPLADTILQQSLKTVKLQSSTFFEVTEANDDEPELVVTALEHPVLVAIGDKQKRSSSNEVAPFKETEAVHGLSAPEDVVAVISSSTIQSSVVGLELDICSFLVPEPEHRGVTTADVVSVLSPDHATLSGVPSQDMYTLLPGPGSYDKGDVLVKVKNIPEKDISVVSADKQENSAKRPLDEIQTTVCLDAKPNDVADPTLPGTTPSISTTGVSYKVPVLERRSVSNITGESVSVLTSTKDDPITTSVRLSHEDNNTQLAVLTRYDQELEELSETSPNQSGNDSLLEMSSPVHTESQKDDVVHPLPSAEMSCEPLIDEDPSNKPLIPYPCDEDQKKETYFAEYEDSQRSEASSNSSVHEITTHRTEILETRVIFTHHGDKSNEKQLTLVTADLEKGENQLCDAEIPAKPIEAKPMESNQATMPVLPLNTGTVKTELPIERTIRYLAEYSSSSLSVGFDSHPGAHTKSPPSDSARTQMPERTETVSKQLTKVEEIQIEADQKVLPDHPGVAESESLPCEGKHDKATATSSLKLGTLESAVTSQEEVMPQLPSPSQPTSAANPQACMSEISEISADVQLDVDRKALPGHPRVEVEDLTSIGEHYKASASTSLNFEALEPQVTSSYCGFETIVTSTSTTGLRDEGLSKTLDENLRQSAIPLQLTGEATTEVDVCEVKESASVETGKKSKRKKKQKSSSVVPDSADQHAKEILGLEPESLLQPEQLQASKVQTEMIKTSEVLVEEVTEASGGVSEDKIHLSDIGKDLGSEEVENKDAVPHTTVLYPGQQEKVQKVDESQSKPIDSSLKSEIATSDTISAISDSSPQSFSAPVLAEELDTPLPGGVGDEKKKRKRNKKKGKASTEKSLAPLEQDLPLEPEPVKDPRKADVKNVTEVTTDQSSTAASDFSTCSLVQCPLELSSSSADSKRQITFLPETLPSEMGIDKSELIASENLGSEVAPQEEPGYVQPSPEEATLSNPSSCPIPSSRHEKKKGKKKSKESSSGITSFVSESDDSRSPFVAGKSDESTQKQTVSVALSFAEDEDDNTAAKPGASFTSVTATPEKLISVLGVQPPVLEEISSEAQIPETSKTTVRQDPGAKDDSVLSLTSAKGDSNYPPICEISDGKKKKKKEKSKQKEAVFSPTVVVPQSDNSEERSEDSEMAAFADNSVAVKTSATVPCADLCLEKEEEDDKSAFSNVARDSVVSLAVKNQTESEASLPTSESSVSVTEEEILSRKKKQKKRAKKKGEVAEKDVFEGEKPEYPAKSERPTIDKVDLVVTEKQQPFEDTNQEISPLVDDQKEVRVGEVAEKDILEKEVSECTVTSEHKTEGKVAMPSEQQSLEDSDQPSAAYADNVEEEALTESVSEKPSIDIPSSSVEEINNFLSSPSGMIPKEGHSNVTELLTDASRFVAHTTTGESAQQAEETRVSDTVLSGSSCRGTVQVASAEPAIAAAPSLALTSAETIVQAVFRSEKEVSSNEAIAPSHSEERLEPIDLEKPEGLASTESPEKEVPFNKPTRVLQSDIKLVTSSPEAKDSSEGQLPIEKGNVISSEDTSVLPSMTETVTSSVFSSSNSSDKVLQITKTIKPAVNVSAENVEASELFETQFLQPIPGPASDDRLSLNTAHENQRRTDENIFEDDLRNDVVPSVFAAEEDSRTTSITTDYPTMDQIIVDTLSADATQQNVEKVPRSQSALEISEPACQTAEKETNQTAFQPSEVIQTSLVKTTIVINSADARNLSLSEVAPADSKTLPLDRMDEHTTSVGADSGEGVTPSCLSKSLVVNLTRGGHEIKSATEGHDDKETRPSIGTLEATSVGVLPYSDEATIKFESDFGELQLADESHTPMTLPEVPEDFEFVSRDGTVSTSDEATFTPESESFSQPIHEFDKLLIPVTNSVVQSLVHAAGVISGQSLIEDSAEGKPNALDMAELKSVLARSRSYVICESEEAQVPTSTMFESILTTNIKELPAGPTESVEHETEVRIPLELSQENSAFELPVLADQEGVNQIFTSITTPAPTERVNTDVLNAAIPAENNLERREVETMKTGEFKARFGSDKVSAIINEDRVDYQHESKVGLETSHAHVSQVHLIDTGTSDIHQTGKVVKPDPSLNLSASKDETEAFTVPRDERLKLASNDKLIGSAYKLADQSFEVTTPFECQEYQREGRTGFVSSSKLNSERDVTALTVDSVSLHNVISVTDSSIIVSDSSSPDRHTKASVSFHDSEVLNRYKREEVTTEHEVVGASLRDKEEDETAKVEPSAAEFDQTSRNQSDFQVAKEVISLEETSTTSPQTLKLDIDAAANIFKDDPNKIRIEVPLHQKLKPESEETARISGENLQAEDDMYRTEILILQVQDKVKSGNASPTGVDRKSLVKNSELPDLHISEFSNEAVKPDGQEKTSEQVLEETTEDVAELVTDIIQRPSFAINKLHELDAVLAVRSGTLQKPKPGVHRTSFCYLTAVTQFFHKTTADERVVHVHDNIATLRSAISQKQTVVIEKVIVEIVTTVTEWLETIEYRVYTIKQIATLERRIKEIKDLKEEVRIVEESLDILEEVTEHCVDVVNDETQFMIKSCVRRLQDQVKIVEEVALRSEEEVLELQQRWKDYLNNISAEEANVDLLNKQIIFIENDAPETPVEKLDFLEDLELKNQAEMTNVNFLIEQGQGLVREIPGYNIPVQVFSLQDTCRYMETKIQNERERVLQGNAVIEDYRTYIKEFTDIMNLARVYCNDQVVVEDAMKLSGEIRKRCKFFTCFSHCSSVLNSTVALLDPATRQNYLGRHASLATSADSVLDNAAKRIGSLRVAFETWNNVNSSFLEEDSWLDSALSSLPKFDKVSFHQLNSTLEKYRDTSAEAANHEAVALALMDEARLVHTAVESSEPLATAEDRTAAVHHLQESITHTIQRIYSCRQNLQAYVAGLESLLIWLGKADPQSSDLEYLQKLKIELDLRKAELHEFVEIMLDQALSHVPLFDEQELRIEIFDCDARIENLRQLLDNTNSEETEDVQALGSALDDLQNRLWQADTPIEGDFHFWILRTELHLIYRKIVQRKETVTRLMKEPSSDMKELTFLYSILEELEAQCKVSENQYDQLHNGLRTLRRQGLTLDLWLFDLQRRLNRWQAFIEKPNGKLATVVLRDCEVCKYKLAAIRDASGAQYRFFQSLPKSSHYISYEPKEIEYSALNKQIAQLEAVARSKGKQWEENRDTLREIGAEVELIAVTQELILLRGTVNPNRIKSAIERLVDLEKRLSDRKHQLATLKIDPSYDSFAISINKKLGLINHSLITIRICYEEALRLYEEGSGMLIQVSHWADNQEVWLLKTSGLQPEEKNFQERLDEIEAKQAELALVEEIIEKMVDKVQNSYQERAPLFETEVEGLMISPTGLVDDVESLKRRLGTLKRSMEEIADACLKAESEKQTQTVQVAVVANQLQDARQTLSTVVEEPEAEKTENQLAALRDQLNALSNAERQFAVKAQQPDAVAGISSAFLLEALQDWQTVFQETFASYEQLCIALLKREDNKGVIDSWDDYLNSINKFVQQPTPQDYEHLSEEIQKCELHEILLTRQKALLQLQPQVARQLRAREGGPEMRLVPTSGAISTLANLHRVHQETIDALSRKHTELCDRLNMWELYRKSLQNSLKWLERVDAEKAKLELRRLQEKGLPLLLKRIQAILERLSTGESLITETESYASTLLPTLNSEQSRLLHSQINAVKERLTSSQSGLTTWSDFVKRLANMYTSLNASCDRIQDTYQNISKDIREELPSSLEDLLEYEGVLEGHLQSLKAITVDISSCESTSEEIRSAVGPVDSRVVTQKVWLLGHQREELEHQISTLLFRIQQRKEAEDRFRIKCKKFNTWLNSFEERLKGMYKTNLTELIQAYAITFSSELNSQESEISELKSRSEKVAQLLNIELSKCQAVKDANIASKRYSDIKLLWNTKLHKLREIERAIPDIQNRVTRLLVWLDRTEARILHPLKLIDFSDEEILRSRNDTCEDETEILGKSETVSALLNLSEMMLNDPDVNLQDLEDLYTTVQSLEKRWEILCTLVTQRKNNLDSTEALWNQFRISYEKLSQSLTQCESQIESVSIDPSAKSVIEIESDVTKLHELTQQFDNIDLLNELREVYLTLARESKLDRSGRITSLKNQAVVRFDEQKNKITTAIRKAEEIIDSRRELDAYFDQITVWLAQAKSQLSRLSSMPRDDAHLMFGQIQNQWEGMESVREEIIRLCQTILVRCEAGDAVVLKKRLGDYEDSIEQFEDNLKSVQNQLLSESSHMQVDYELLAVPDLVENLYQQKTSTPCDSHSSSVVEIDQSSVEEPTTDYTKLADRRSYAAVAAALVSVPVMSTSLIPMAAEGSPAQSAQIVEARRSTAVELKAQIEKFRMNMEELNQTLKSVNSPDQIESLSEVTRLVNTCHGCQDETSRLSKCLADCLLTQQMTSAEYAENQKLVADAFDLAKMFTELEIVARTNNLQRAEISATMASDHLSDSDVASSVSPSAGSAVRKARRKKQKTKKTQSDAADKGSCPQCNTRTWKQQDHDMWRLEHWIQAAENKLEQSSKSSFNSMEQLEDAIQDQRELLLDLDSHRSLIVSLNIVGTHLREHAPSSMRSTVNQLTDRLGKLNARWEVVCADAKLLQGRLQKTLLQNEEFRGTIKALLTWLDKTEGDIRATEPLNLNSKQSVLKKQLSKFQEVKNEVEICEPRVASLRVATEQLFEDSADAESASLKTQLQLLPERLAAVLALVAAYCKTLETAIKEKPTRTTIISLSDQILSGSSTPLEQSIMRTSTHSPAHSSRTETDDSGPEEEGVDTTVIRRGYRFLGRVVRAALPIQALMLVLIGVASLMPGPENDWRCALTNSLSHILEPALRYPDGPPPT